MLTITNILLVANSEFVKIINTNPIGKTKAPSSVASEGLDSRSPGAPPDQQLAISKR
jgi:hypothetical protein